MFNFVYVKPVDQTEKVNGSDQTGAGVSPVYVWMTMPRAGTCPRQGKLH